MNWHYVFFAAELAFFVAVAIWGIRFLMKSRATSAEE